MHKRELIPQSVGLFGRPLLVGGGGGLVLGLKCAMECFTVSKLFPVLQKLWLGNTCYISVQNPPVSYRETSR
jgi:hypothetical protein